MAVLGDLVVRLLGDVKPLKNVLGQAQGLLGGFAATVGATLGAGASIAAATQDIAAMAKLSAVLDATGGAARVTAAEIGNLASELQAVTNFGDETTVAAAGVLASFKTIKGEAFKDTIVVAQDLASVFETDLKSATVALGKALSSPADGLTALSRVGVKFTEEQQGQIKALAESGRLMEAQKLILTDLQGRFGGAAKAMADPITQLKNAIGDVGEEIGKVLLPLVQMLANVVIPFLKNWGSEIAKVVVAIFGLVAVMRTITVVQKAIAVGQALIAALAGPAGWATLAAGTAVFAGALIGINAAMGDIAATTKNATEAVEQFSDRFAGVWNRPGDDAKNPFGVPTEADTKALTTIRDLKDEIAKLKGTSDDAWIALRNMIDAGVDPSILQQFEDLQNELKKLKADAAETDRLKSIASNIVDATRTPLEQFEQKMQEARDALAKGLIDQDTFDRFQKMQEDAPNKGAATASESAAAAGPVSAAVAGSREALSSIVGSMREKTQERIAKAAEEQLREQERQTALLEELAATAEVVEIG